MATFSETLKSIYISSNRSRLLLDAEYFLDMVAEQYQPSFREDCKLLERSVRQGVGNVINQYLEQDIWPDENGRNTLIGQMKIRCGFTSEESERILNFLFYMVGWTKIPPYEAPSFPTNRSQPITPIQPAKPVPPVTQEVFWGNTGLIFKESDLANREDLIEPYNYLNRPDITIDKFAYDLQDSIRIVGLPVTLTLEDLRIGGLFSGETQKIILLTNSEHPRDYFRYIIRLQEIGNVLRITAYANGQSKAIKKQHQYGESNDWIAKATGAAKRVDMKVEEEMKYYFLLSDAISATLECLDDD